MAISLTCVCGAILEIDDKFRGQRIPCPDCNRLLDTTPPPPPPQATSGWALASVIFSVAGMLTLIGPLVGIACGFVGLQQVRRDPKLAGVNFARAGIVLGAVFSLVSMWALFGSEFLGLDGFYRLYVGANKDLSFKKEIVVRAKVAGDYYITIKRPSPAWGIRQASNTDVAEDLTLVNLWEDAHIVVLGVRLEPEDGPDDCRREAINTFLKTSLVKTLTKTSEPLPFPPSDRIKVLKEDEKNPRQQEFIVEFSWPGVPRVFLFRVFTQPGQASRVNVAIGGARQTRFDRLEESIRQALESCQLEEDTK
jgi:hypothetical protein